MDYLTSSGFNQERPKKMLLDINSCFATIEQQANPLLRGKEVVVAAYENGGGCILAASREAKKLGIKTGWRVGEAQKICPKLIVLTPDVEKYRFINKGLNRILLKFSPEVQSKSIDEFAVDFGGINEDLKETGLKIKKEIRKVLGEWITVSIGIGANIFLAKVASNLQKPDGLTEINKENFWEIYGKLKLTDLHGINNKTAYKLEVNGIKNPQDFYKCSRQKLKSIFKSVGADYWYWRLRGFEIDDKERIFKKSFSAIFSLKIPAKNRQELAAIFYQLCLKVGRRCDRQKMEALGIMWWGGGRNININGKLRIKEGMINGWEMFNKIYPKIPEFSGEIKKAVIAIYDLRVKSWQGDIFGQRQKFIRETEVAEEINNKFGEGTIFPGTILLSKRIPDFIGFGQRGL
jgi:DNA polymerase-4